MLLLHVSSIRAHSQARARGHAASRPWRINHCSRGALRAPRNLNLLLLLRLRLQLRLRLLRLLRLLWLQLLLRYRRRLDPLARRGWGLRRSADGPGAFGLIGRVVLLVSGACARLLWGCSDHLNTGVQTCTRVRGTVADPRLAAAPAPRVFAGAATAGKC